MSYLHTLRTRDASCRGPGVKGVGLQAMSIPVEALWAWWINSMPKIAGVKSIAPFCGLIGPPSILTFDSWDDGQDSP